ISESKGRKHDLERVQVPHEDPLVPDYSLCSKPSFFVCQGKKSPDLVEVNSFTDLRQLQAGGEPIGLSLQQTPLKIQGIMKRQHNIIKMV
ncbi:hypothetical protein KR009_007967, partial [Drosophila setifemur]